MKKLGPVERALNCTYQNSQYNQENMKKIFKLNKVKKMIFLLNFIFL
jgi:hypothetical protein